MSPKTALLVIDCQNFFAPMLGSALPNIKRLITQFQSTSSPILFTQHGHSEEELNTDPSPNQLVKKWGPSGSIAHGSDDWQLIPELLEYLPPSATSKHSLPLPSTDANTSAASNFSAEDKTWQDLPEEYLRCVHQHPVTSVLEGARYPASGGLWCHDGLLLRHDGEECVQSWI